VVSLPQPGVLSAAHCACPEKQLALQKGGLLKDHLGAGPSARLARGHARHTASHRVRHTFRVAPLSHLPHPILISSPWAAQSIPWFSWGPATPSPGAMNSSHSERWFPFCPHAHGKSYIFPSKDVANT